MSRRRLQKLNDLELIEVYRQSGDKKAVGILYERYAHLLLGVCLKYMKDRAAAEDALMTVFESLYQLLTKHEIQNVRSWLWTVTRNQCLMELRKSKPTTETDHLSLTYEDQSEEKLILEGRLEQMEKALSSLNQEQQTCVRLFYLEKLSYQQIESQTGYPIKKVKSYIQNGKRNLAIKMKAS